MAQNKNKIINILNENNYSSEDSIIILRTFLSKTKRILRLAMELEESKDINKTINSAKPPIFWKDKATMINLAKRWDKQRLLDVIIYFGKIERILKTQTNINSLTVVKNSITNICSNSWTYF